MGRAISSFIIASVFQLIELLIKMKSTLYPAMLGDQVGEDKGKVTSQRVIEIVNGIPKIETSFS
jgi:hypothetical protein